MRCPGRSLRFAALLVVVLTTGPARAQPQTPAPVQQQLDELMRRQEELRSAIDAIRAATPLPAPAPLQQQLDELMRRQEELRRQIEELRGGAGMPALRPAPSPNGAGPTRVGEQQALGSATAPPVRVTMDDGFRAETDHVSFLLHVLTQAQYTAVVPPSSEVTPARVGTPLGSPGGFTIPRDRIYFDSEAFHLVELYTVFEAAYGNQLKPDISTDLLDAYLELKLDPRFNVRFGHFRSPFLYEFYALPENHLIGPERSVVNNTVIPERQTGLMTRGELFEGVVDYAGGVFNGPNHLIYNSKTALDSIGMLDVRPWWLAEGHPLQHLHLVASVDFGQQNTSPTPTPMYRVNSEMDTSFNSAATLVSPAWLTFNPNATLKGGRLLTGEELAWFYNGWTTLGGIYNGWQHYAPTSTASSVKAPVNGYSAAVTYFLTGEKPIDRADLTPLRKFDPLQPLQNPGAVEVYARFAELNVGHQLTDSGAAMAAESTHKVDILDVGVAWYLNKYALLVNGWQYSHLANPIAISPGKVTNHFNLFTVRFQYFF